MAAQLNDSGKYICIAQNSLSRILVGAELTVQGTTDHTHTHAHTRSGWSLRHSHVSAVNHLITAVVQSVTMKYKLDTISGLSSVIVGTARTAHPRRSSPQSTKRHRAPCTNRHVLYNGGILMHVSTDTLLDYSVLRLLATSLRPTCCDYYACLNNLLTYSTLNRYHMIITIQIRFSTPTRT